MFHSLVLVSALAFAGWCYTPLLKVPSSSAYFGSGSIETHPILPLEGFTFRQLLPWILKSIVGWGLVPFLPSVYPVGWCHAWFQAFIRQEALPGF